MSVGYTDYGRQALEVGPLLFSEIPTVGAGGYDGGMVHVGNYNYILVYANVDAADTQNYRFELAWYDDQAKTTYLKTTYMTVMPGYEAHCQFECLGSWVSVQVKTDTGASAKSLPIRIVGRMARVDRCRADSPLSLFLTQEVSVPAGGTVYANNTVVSNGRSVINTGAYSTVNWRTLVEVYNWFTTSWDNYSLLAGGTSLYTVTAPFILPATPVRVNLHNTDTASKTMLVHIL